MKKLSFLAIAAFAAFTFSACGGKSEAGGNADSTNIDSAQTEAEPEVDPNKVETDYFTINLPEGWERNGKENKNKTDLKTNNTIPQYYVTIEVISYRKTIDEWKEDINEGFKADGTMEVGDKTFTVMSWAGAFYKIKMATPLPDEKGVLSVTFTGDSEKEASEQKEILKKLVEAVVMK